MGMDRVTITCGGGKCLLRSLEAGKPPNKTQIEKGVIGVMVHHCWMPDHNLC